MANVLGQGCACLVLGRDHWHGDQWLGMMVASGAREILSGAVDAPLPDFSKYLPRAPHGLGARLMLALLALHAGAALYHHFLKRDGLLWRMWYGAD